MNYNRNWNSSQKEAMLVTEKEEPNHPSHRETFELRDQLADIETTFLTRVNYPFNQVSSKAYETKMQNLWDLAVEKGRVSFINVFELSSY
jgi:hypothetical protein